MRQTTFFCAVLFGLAAGIPVPTAFPQGYAVDECVSFATGRHSVGSRWSETKGGVSYRCVCDRSRGTVCTPAAQGGSGGAGFPPSRNPAGGRPSTGNWKRDMVLGMMDSFTQGFARGLQRSSDARREAERQAALEEQKRYEEQWQRDIAAQFQDMRQQYVRRRQEETGAKRERILNRLKAPDDGAQRNASSMDLRCSAWWSLQAAQTAAEGSADSVEKAKAFSDKAALAMSGDHRGCPEIRPPAIPMPADVGHAEEFNTLFYDALKTELQEKTALLQKIRRERAELSESVKTIQNNVSELKRKKEQTAGDPDAERQSDQLLRDALATLEQAKKDEAAAAEIEANQKRDIQAMGEISKILAVSQTKENKERKEFCRF